MSTCPIVAKVEEILAAWDQVVWNMSNPPTRFAPQHRDCLSACPDNKGLLNQVYTSFEALIAMSIGAGYIVTNSAGGTGLPFSGRHTLLTADGKPERPEVHNCHTGTWLEALLAWLQAAGITRRFIYLKGGTSVGYTVTVQTPELFAFGGRFQMYNEDAGRNCRTYVDGVEVGLVWYNAGEGPPGEDTRDGLYSEPFMIPPDSKEIVFEQNGGTWCELEFLPYTEYVS